MKIAIEITGKCSKRAIESRLETTLGTDYECLEKIGKETSTNYKHSWDQDEAMREYKRSIADYHQEIDELIRETLHKKRLSEFGYELVPEVYKYTTALNNSGFLLMEYQKTHKKPVKPKTSIQSTKRVVLSRVYSFLVEDNELKVFLHNVFLFYKKMIDDGIISIFHNKDCFKVYTVGSQEGFLEIKDGKYYNFNGANNFKTPSQLEAETVKVDGIIEGLTNEIDSIKQEMKALKKKLRTARIDRDQYNLENFVLGKKNSHLISEYLDIKGLIRLYGDIEDMEKRITKMMDHTYSEQSDDMDLFLKEFSNDLKSIKEEKARSIERDRKIREKLLKEGIA